MRSYLEPVVVDQHPRAEGGVVRQHLWEWERRAWGAGGITTQCRLHCGHTAGRNAGYNAGCNAGRHICRLLQCRVHCGSNAGHTAVAIMRRKPRLLSQARGDESEAQPLPFGSAKRHPGGLGVSLTRVSQLAPRAKARALRYATVGGAL